MRVSRLVGVLGLVFVLLLSCLWQDGARLVWSADSGTRPPERFIYLAFPRTWDVPLLDRPDGNAVDVLDRALGNTLDEALTDQWIRVNGKAGNTWVRGSDLVLDPGDVIRTPMVQRYSDRLVQSSGDRFAIASLTVTDRDGSKTFRLEHHFDDSIDIYEYAEKGTLVVPLAYYRVNGMEVGFAGVARLVTGLTLLFVVWLGIKIGEEVWIWRGGGGRV